MSQARVVKVLVVRSAVIRLIASPTCQENRQMNIATSPTVRHAILVTALCMGGLASPQASAANGGDWEWVVAPYLWAVSFDTDLERTEPPAGGISSDRTFDDVLDQLDGVFEVHLEGQQEQWGMFTDFTYLGLADDSDHPRFRTETDLDGRLFELAGVWNPAAGRYQGLDVFAGLRYIDIDFGVQFDPVNPLFNTTSFDGSESFNDFMLGARYTWPLSENWGMTLRGDGSFGDTDGTWNASAVANYKFSYGALILGYRYLSVELENGGTDIDLTLDGPMVGYGFTF